MSTFPSRILTFLSNFDFTKSNFVFTKSNFDFTKSNFDFTKSHVDCTFRSRSERSNRLFVAQQRRKEHKCCSNTPQYACYTSPPPLPPLPLQYSPVRVARSYRKMKLSTQPSNYGHKPPGLWKKVEYYYTSAIYLPTKTCIHTFSCLATLPSPHRPPLSCSQSGLMGHEEHE